MPGLDDRVILRYLLRNDFQKTIKWWTIISEIIAGKASLEPHTALQFEKVLGVDASIWLGIESNYRLFEARKSEVDAVSGVGKRQLYK